MRIRLNLATLLAFWLHSIETVNGSIIDDSGPNPLVVGKAFGFMLFGNEGFLKPGIENLVVDGCKVSFETDGGLYPQAIQRIYIR